MMITTTRFAPSPTGILHVGNIRTALHNWLLAEKARARGDKARFLLRIDDTDTVRSEEAHIAAIRADLGWLGLSYDLEVRQSERFVLYDEVFARLEAKGRVYRCYESPAELEIKRKILLGRGLPPLYDRSALRLTITDHAAKAAAGDQPHWRFLLDHDSPITWNDGIRGAQHFDPAQMSDPIVRRADGSWLYLLPSVIDDIEMGVSQILRGEDHVTNTAVQVQMFQALGASVPNFAHEALLVGTEGKLSKRLGSLGVAALREAGIEPMAMIALLARLGTSDPVDPSLSLSELIAGFDLGHFGRAPARFDEAELQRINAGIIHRLSYEAVRSRLPDAMGHEAWQAIRPNVSTVAEAVDLWEALGRAPLWQEPPEDALYLQEAANTLAQIVWGATIWRDLTAALQASTGRKGRALFQPLRLALTGETHGPEMAALLPLIGYDAALARLRAAGHVDESLPNLK